MQHLNIFCPGILFTVITQLIHLAIINDRCKCSLIWPHLPFMVGSGILSGGHTCTFSIFTRALVGLSQPILSLVQIICDAPTWSHHANNVFHLLYCIS
jgi:hypothetical protein